MATITPWIQGLINKVIEDHGDEIIHVQIDMPVKSWTDMSMKVGILAIAYLPRDENPEWLERMRTTLRGYAAIAGYRIEEEDWGVGFRWLAIKIYDGESLLVEYLAQYDDKEKS